ncbi:DNA-directed RNA polymerase large [Plakobranchus ocellatus]|uniref:DNA-directed RNA polymerase large n=1 Tax=Plakobranchus ocellatus TaxID=259542 RepID=A0AAV4BQ75_9GAST|nr:DNA-directed RNA polymerase large [Plakobranchus ocellatus]
MDPLSRSMRIVRLAQQRVAMDMAGTSHGAVESVLETGASTPIHSPVQESEIDTSLNKISFTELLPVASNHSADDLNNEMDSTMDNSFSCYFPTAKKKTNILISGNMIANTKYVDDAVFDQVDISTTTEINVSMSTCADFMPTKDASRPIAAASMSINVESMPTSDVCMPTWNVSMPTGDVAMPTGDVIMPTGDLSIPTGDVSMPTGVVSMPDGDVSMIANIKYVDDAVYNQVDISTTTENDVSMSTCADFMPTKDASRPIGDVSMPINVESMSTNGVSIHTGDVFIRTGDVSTPTGDVFVRTGDVHTPTGDVLVRNGDVSTTVGDISASNDDASIPNGDVSVSTGDVIMSTNDISTPAEISYSVPINIDISMPLDVDATESESGGVSVDVPTDCPTEAAIAGRSKKRKADESKWFKLVNKNKREKGEVYMGRKYETGSRKFKIVEKPGKELGERCYCKSVGLKCGDVPDEKRDGIFKEE